MYAETDAHRLMTCSVRAGARSFPYWLLVLLCLCLPTAASTQSLPDFTTLVERQGPAVVNISTTQAARPSSLPAIPGLEEGDPMFDLFRRFIPRLPGEPREGSPFRDDSRSLGSGFIVSPDGFILTNAHVIEDADEVIVRLSDKREFRAEVVGTDARSDVAVIRIDASGLPTVRMGDPEALKVGEWVVAIGSPFGFDHSVTAGIVSAKGRSLPDENFVPFIQTDVAINPGNSGGPLFNLRGEVVGMNSQIYSQTGGFMGLSFAIPIDVAMDVQQQLRTVGIVRRGRIGVAIQEVTRSIADSFGLPDSRGALVSSVEPSGPADQAGVQAGDVIQRFDGKEVETSGDLPRIVAASRPGSEAEMRVWRDGRAQVMQVTVGEWQEEVRKDAVRAPGAATPNKLGLVVRETDAKQRAENGLEHGLLVERVGAPAARSEIRSGDWLLAMVVGGERIVLDRVSVFEQRVAGLAAGEVVSLLVHRNGGTLFVTLRAQP